MITYFTTFNEKLYHVSGKHLINSFKKYTPVDSEFLIFHENVQNLHDESNIKFINMLPCEFYSNWFNEYKHIIPTKFGGLANIEMDKRLQYGLSVKWNQKACLWFWKIIAMKYVLQYMHSDTKYFVFLDSDTEFVNTIDTNFYDKMCFNFPLAFHLGKFRKAIDNKKCAGIESGILVFKNNSDAHFLIQYILDIYISGDFQRFLRWDDGFILRKVAENFPAFCNDLTPKANIKNVISCGPFKNIIVHHIGKHHRLNIYD